MRILRERRVYMIEFKGCITGNAEQYFWKRSRNILRNILITVILVLFPAFFVTAILVGHLGILIIYALLSASMLLSLLIPKSKKEKNAWLPKRIFTDEEYIVCTSEKYEEFKLIQDASCVIDYGDFYYIVFPFGKISDKFVCQKDLLTQGTLEEFEALFDGKIERKFASPKVSE